ncbi:MAG: phage tail protein [Alphaproteobacteria bacterium]|nr:phage tail protein [Alphaproteobacteria bacterium]
MTVIQSAGRPGVVVHVANAFRPERGRSVRPVLRAQTVREWLDGQGVAEFDAPTLCLFNGAPLMRSDWGAATIGTGDVCAFVALPHGGGGGGGKNPLRTVLSIALMVGGIYLGASFGAPLASSFGFGAETAVFGSLTGGKLFGGLISGAVSLVGGALVNTLVPAPRPSASAFAGGSFGSPPAPSPTYSLQGQSNSARLGQPAPCQYGRHLIYPDLIMAEPWVSYEGNEQFVHQPHCLGLGEFEIERIRIAETDIDNFEEVTTELVPPGGAIGLFDVNVITRPEVSGQELDGTNEQSGDGYVGPFILNPVDTEAHTLGVDIVFPRGLYFANDSGGLNSKTVTWVIETRPIDDEDQPVGAGDWSTIGSESHSANDNTPIRLTFNYPIAAPGRYEVRARRTDAKDTSSRAGHNIRWAGLKAFVDGPTVFEDVTLLLVKMRATDNLSQRTARAVNVIQTRKLPIYDPAAGAWSEPQPTRSVVWAAADVCRAAYGAALDDSRLSLADLAALDAALEARGDRFDGVFDSKTTVWDALTRIARCGRATPILQGGVIRIIRDAPQSLPTAMFGPRNMVRGTLQIDYIMPSDDTADAVTVEFFNQRTWKPAEVTASLPDSSAEKPATVSLFGCVDKDHARREGDYMAADNRYRRRIVSFRTELEGMIPTYGDLIAVTHDLPRWGQGGEVTAWDAEAEVLTLSEPLDWTDGETHYIALRARDGSLAGPFQCDSDAASGLAADQVQLLDPLTLTPYTGSDEERTYFSFGPGEKWSQLCRVLSVRPRNGGEQVEITAVAEDSRVHVN